MTKLHRIRPARTGEADLTEVRLPPDKQEKATQTVLEEAEVLSHESGKRTPVSVWKYRG